MTGAELAKTDLRDDEGKTVFTIQELHWFRKNAYNLGITSSPTWHLTHTIRILTACLAFIACYPPDIPLADATENALMAMRCHFVVATALVSMARTEDAVDVQLQRYTEMKQHITAFDETLQIEAEAQSGRVIQDLIGKAAALFVFGFEGAIALRQWTELGEIVRKAKTCCDETVYKAMGDCLLRSRAPGKSECSI